MKGLGPRAHNILFHTHTVSGIVISLILFIIFFSGAISLYKQEIYQWENPEARIPVVEMVNYERLIHRMDSIKPGAGDGHEIRAILPTPAKPVYTFYVPIEDSTGVQFSTFFYNPITESLSEQSSGEWSTTGETLYRLHFLDQVPLYIGRYIAGIVSLFFVFAVLTGILIHWKNIVSKFYAFSFKKITKQFWTNAHTVFGVIGLPFQLMYAVTGAFYMLSLLILAPTVMVLFEGDDHDLIEMLYPMEEFHSHDEEEAMDAVHIPVSEGLHLIRQDYPAYRIAFLDMINLGKENAVLGAELIDQSSFNQNGTVVLDLHSGDYKLRIEPGDKTYAQSILQGISNIHFGSFGGWLSKALYFMLSIFTCFVIISGVLMWKEARNKSTYTDRQRRFHHRVTMLYLSICFGLFPATAVLFIAEQLISPGTGRVDIVNAFFFYSWLVFAIIGYFLKSEKRITQFYLFTGGVLSCIVMLANGYMTGDWPWIIANKHPYVFATDIIWCITGFFALLLAFMMKWSASGDPALSRRVNTDLPISK